MDFLPINFRHQGRNVANSLLFIRITEPTQSTNTAETWALIRAKFPLAKQIQ